jgi:hypothetical protein
MQKRSRITGLLMALLGSMVLFMNLGKPRIAALHGADVMSLVACGFLFGIAFMGLLAKLRLGDEKSSTGSQIASRSAPEP